MLKKYVYLYLITIFVLFNFSVALAQTSEIEITTLETQIMPEYDTADILIVNSIKLTNKSNNDFSGDLKWLVPKGSLKHIVTTNSNNHLQFNIVPSQANDELVWKLPNPLKAGESRDIHLEFYYNNLQGSPDKKFTYDFVPAYPVISAKMLLLQPTKASNLKITPEFGQPMSNQGWTYYVKGFNNLAKDQGTNITVFYTKTDPSPSVVPGQQQSGQTPNNQSIYPANSSNDKVWIIAAAAIAIVIVVTVTYSKVQRNNRENHELDDYEENEAMKEDASEYEENDELDFKMSKKKELRRKLEEGLITQVDYYEAVMELEDEE